MSQFQNQNQMVEYRGRQAFEQPISPSVYQEQMPILPTPSFKIGYTGINLAEVGYFAAKAGSSIADSLFEYDFIKKQEALSSIQTETEAELDAAYRNGADNATVDSIRDKAKGKINTLLNLDIDDPAVKEEDFTKSMGTKPGSLVIAGRKTITGIDASNGRYKQNLKANDYITNASLASMQVSEEFAKNPNAPIETYDVGIDAVERILKSILPKDAPINSSTIGALTNPADKEAAMKAYTALIKLREDKLEAIAKQQKFIGESEEAMLKAEQDSRKNQNEIFRDTFKSFGDKLNLINERLEFLQKIPQEERTPEVQQEIFQLIRNYTDLQDQVRSETIGFVFGRYGQEVIDMPQPQTGEPLDFETMALINPVLDFNSDSFDRTIIGDAAVDTPTVREAYGQFKTANQKVQNQIGTTRLDLIQKEKKAQSEHLASFWKQAEADVILTIASYESQGILDRNKGSLLQRLENFNSIALDTILPFLGENQLRDIHNKFNLNYEEEKKKGFLKIKEILKLNTPVEQQPIIHAIFENNSTAWNNWNAASLAYKGLEARIFKEGDTGGSGARAKQQELNEALGIMAGTLSNGRVTGSTFGEAADVVVLKALDPSGSLDLSNISAVSDAIKKASTDPEGKPIQLDVLVASRAASSIYTGAKTANDLITAFGSVLPKDNNGNVIIPQPTAWTSQVNGTDFPVVRVIEEDLKKDSNSVAFQKALTMFSLLPDKWRDQLVSAVGNKGIIRTLNEEIKNRKGANLATLTSIASRGGYTDELIQAATSMGARYAERSLYTRTKTETTAGDETAEETAERTRIVNGIVAELSKGQKDAEGNLLPFQNGFKPLSSLNEYRLAGLNTQMDFKWIVSRAAKYYALYRTDMPVQEASSRAIKEAIQEFKDERLVTPRGTVDMGTMPRDMLFSVDATGSFPQEKTGEGRLYPNQNPNSVILDQDPIDFVTTEATKFQGKQKYYDSSYGFRIGSESNFTILDTTFGGRVSGGGKISFVTPATKQVYFANSVLTTQNNNGGLSKANRIALARLKFPDNATNEQNQGMIIGEIIEATMTPEQTTTRRDILVSAAVLKEIELAQQDPKSDFETWDQVLTFAKDKANEIRETLKQTGDKPTSDSPYTIMVTSGFTTSSTGSYEVVPNLQLLRKLPDGSWQIMSNIREDFASAGYSGYTKKGNATDVEVASGIPQKDLETAPIPVLTQTMQDLYNKGLIKESFVIFPKDSEGRSNIYRIPDLMSGRFGVEQNMTLENEGNKNLAVAVVVTVDNGVVKVDRGLKEVSYSSGFFNRLFTGLDDSAPSSVVKEKIIEVIPSETKARPVPTVQKEELSPSTLKWMQQAKRYGTQQKPGGAPILNVLGSIGTPANQLTLYSVPPNTSIENAIKFPNKPINYKYDINPVNISIVYDKQKELYFAVPDPTNVQKYGGNLKTTRHLGGFYSREDAELYIRELKLFLANEKPQQTQTEVESLSSVMNLYMPTSLSSKRQDVSPETSKTIDEIPFTLEQTQTLRQIYERVYGVEGAKIRIEQAMERQKNQSIATLAIRPDYENTTAYSYYRPTDPDTRLNVLGQAIRDKDKTNTFVVLSNKDEATAPVELHEGIHTTQKTWSSGVSILFTKEELDAMTPEEYYVLNKSEIPAWIGQLKAQYYLETKKELFPNSDQKAYDDFLTWMQTKTKDKKQGKYIQHLYDLFVKESPRKKLANETLRQVAFNSSMDETTTLI